MTDETAYGRLEERGDGRWALHFTRLLPHPVEKVWRAVTEPGHLAGWFPTTIEGDRAPGARLRFSFPGGQAQPFEGEMLAYDPPWLLEFRWGPDIIRIELRSVPGGTELTLLDVLDERGKGARDAAGWHVCLDNLAAHLAGVATADDSGAAWRAVHPRYVESFGPEAASIGPPQGI
ncbi:MAG TPA: SRPBCC family protein [Dehalococcoidia bacterium]|nr:SRPBCC family protein [Dehalococcoidia bacterium]